MKIIAHSKTKSSEIVTFELKIPHQFVMLFLKNKNLNVTITDDDVPYKQLIKEIENNNYYPATIEPKNRKRWDKLKKNVIKEYLAINSNSNTTPFINALNPFRYENIIVTANVLNLFPTLRFEGMSLEFYNICVDIYNTVKASTPKLLDEYEVHLPYSDLIEQKYTYSIKLSEKIKSAASLCHKRFYFYESEFPHESPFIANYKHYFDKICKEELNEYLSHVVFVADKKSLFNIYNNYDNLNIYSSETNTIGSFNDKSLVFISLETIIKNKLDYNQFINK